MGQPSEANLQAQLKAAVDLLEETRKYAAVNSANWLGKEDAYLAILDTNFGAEALAGVAAGRAGLDGSVRSAAAILAPLIRQYGEIIGAPETDPLPLMARLYDHFIANSLSVKTRAFTFGSPTAAGGNAGNGVLLRDTKDENNYDLEAQWADAKVATCVRDAATGAEKHEEVFELRDAAPYRDALKLTGGGHALGVRALSARDSLLLNPSFSQRSGTSALPTAITSWTSSTAVVGDGSDYTFDETNYYRDFPGDATPRALNIKLTRTLTQKLTVRGTKLDPNVPYMLQVAWNRQVGSGAGTLLIRMGAQSNSVVAAAQTGWQLLRVPSSPGQNNWYKNFDEQDLDISLEWTRTSGDLLIDDVLLVPATLFAGSWHWILGGATPFLRDDKFTWADTETGAKVQHWLFRAFGRYLPHASSPTLTDP